MNSINAKYLRKQINEDGHTEITLELCSIQDDQIIEELKKNSLYRIKMNEIKSQRTIEQNNYLWSLIHEISVARNGNLATSEDDWDVYLEALETAQAKCEIIACLPEAYPYLKGQFRTSKVLNEFEHKGKTFLQVKVFYGSSKLDVAEMAKLLDIVIMMAQNEGIELTYYG